MPQVRVGDVFVIPIDESRSAFGQVVARYKDTELYCLAVFGIPFSPGQDVPDLTGICEQEIVLLANTFDAILADGGWKIIGNTRPCTSRVPFPWYKILTIGTYYAESWDGSLRRQATPAEVGYLDNRGGVAPIRLENATKAHFGVLPWQQAFDKLTYEHWQRRSQPEA